MRDFLRRVLIGASALLAASTLTACGTCLNLAGYENPLPTLLGPDNGQVVTVPQGAMFGGTLLDVAICQSTGELKEADYGRFGKTTMQTWGFGKWTYCQVGWWPTPPVWFWALDMPLSLAADFLLLPITVFTDPGPAKKRGPRTNFVPPPRDRVDP